MADRLFEHSAQGLAFFSGGQFHVFVPFAVARRGDRPVALTSEFFVALVRFVVRSDFAFT
jgi:hypothetical protein